MGACAPLPDPQLTRAGIPDETVIGLEPQMPCLAMVPCPNRTPIDSVVNAVEGDTINAASRARVRSE